LRLVDFLLAILLLVALVLIARHDFAGYDRRSFTPPTRPGGAPLAAAPTASALPSPTPQTTPGARTS
jgi:hypothetical protein